MTATKIRYLSLRSSVDLHGEDGVTLERSLFGGDEEFQDVKKFISHYQKVKKQMRFRVSDVIGKSCKNCQNLTGVSHGGRAYYKCKLIGNSSSNATDIRLKNLCDEWKLKED